ncbi:MAG: MarR family transcriptional regulator [Frankiales bacterium]|nr:MarR family transcriptional regulator [Frankiales bacterium]
MRFISCSRIGNTALSELSGFEVGQAYLQLYRRLHRLVDEAMSATGISLSRSKVLTALAEHGPMNQSTLAGRLGFAPRSVTDTVDSLQRDGFAGRTPDPADRRAWIVGITPAGSIAQQNAQATKHKIFEQIFGALDGPARATLVALLSTVERSLEAPETSESVSGECYGTNIRTDS